MLQTLEGFARPRQKTAIEEMSHSHRGLAFRSGRPGYLLRTPTTTSPTPAIKDTQLSTGENWKGLLLLMAHLYGSEIHISLFMGGRKASQGEADNGEHNENSSLKCPRVDISDKWSISKASVGR